MGNLTTLEKAELAIKHRLYSNPNWQLLYALRHCVKRKGVGYSISLTFVDNIPVSIALLKKPVKLVMAFTRVKHRGKGYASANLNAVKVKGCFGGKRSPSKGKIFQYNEIDVNEDW